MNDVPYTMISGEFENLDNLDFLLSFYPIDNYLVLDNLQRMYWHVSTNLVE